MTLYRKNILLSHELFAVISCFEIALRNKIDKHYLEHLGNDWIAKATNGMFLDEKYLSTKRRIDEKLKKLGKDYSHDKLIAEMDFGFWRHLFASPQFKAAGSSLLKIFSDKPKSSVLVKYNHSYVFDGLQKINNLRNRIAHHEPICFMPGTSIIDSSYARHLYGNILRFFNWMNIDEKSLMHGLDHVLGTCDEIDHLKATSPSSPSLSPYSSLPSATRH